MLSYRLAPPLTLFLGLASSWPSSQLGRTPRNETSSITTNNATAFAITYGYTLIQYASSLDPVLSSLGANAIFHENTTATAGQAAIVRPNVDTVYSKVAVDLSTANVALTIPPVTDGRFYVFPFYDLWGNNFVNLGSLHDTMPGRYLLRPAECSSKVGFEASTNDSVYLGFINFPTTYGLLLPRILLLNNSSDLDAVHAIQAQIKVEEIPQPRRAYVPPLTTDLLGNGTLASMALVPPELLDQSSVQELLQVVARVSSYNLPIDPTNLPEVVDNFKAAGLFYEQYMPPQDVNYTLANQLVTEYLLASIKSLETYNNQWVDWIPQYSGNFHSGYNVRAWIAYTGYLQLVQSEAIYPEWSGGSDFGLSLAADQSYILTFPSGKPPVRGFWSITAYNSSSYLIPNSFNVYAFGDRSNLTYPDGTLVYGGSDRNEPFSILIQPADLPPPSNWTSNWLPAPAGGGNFTVNLRFYGPNEPLAVNGSYIYPIVTKQGAIIS